MLDIFIKTFTLDPFDIRHGSTIPDGVNVRGVDGGCDGGRLREGRSPPRGGRRGGWAKISGRRDEGLSADLRPEAELPRAVQVGKSYGEDLVAPLTNNTFRNLIEGCEWFANSILVFEESHKQTSINRISIATVGSGRRIYIIIFIILIICIVNVVFVMNIIAQIGCLVWCFTLSSSAAINLRCCRKVGAICQQNSDAS